MMTWLTSSIQGSLLALACGDALGAAVQGMAHDRIALAFPHGLMPFQPGHPESKLPNHPPGLPTDETLMSLGLAEAYMLEAGMLSIPTLIQSWLRGYHEGPPISDKASQQALMKLANGVSFLKCASPFPSYGAAMRVAPIGLIFAFEADYRESDSYLQATLTHEHPEAEAGSLAIAEALAFLVRAQGRPFSRDAFLGTLAKATTPISPAFTRALCDLPDGPRDVSSHVSDTVPAALSLFLQHRDDLPRAVMTAAAAGGVTDTLASMVGALAGAYLGLDAIPMTWRNALQNLERVERAAKGTSIIAVARWASLQNAPQ